MTQKTLINWVINTIFNSWIHIRIRFSAMNPRSVLRLRLVTRSPYILVMSWWNIKALSVLFVMHLWLFHHLRILSMASLVWALMVNVYICVIVINYDNFTRTIYLRRILHFLLMLDVLLDVILGLFLKRILLRHDSSVKVMLNWSVYCVTMNLFLICSLSICNLVTWFEDFLFCWYVICPDSIVLIILDQFGHWARKCLWMYIHLIIILVSLSGIISISSSKYLLTIKSTLRLLM